jgi:hypothetical protein
VKRVSYKALYLKERSRREAYERFEPSILTRWSIFLEAAKEFNEDIERTFVFGINDANKTRGITNFIGGGNEGKESGW